ncbi:hypothetical protein PROFUN_05753 [Planoprotostelium fungivorum]|uniref:Uncharacterized protein n=1 Tax=Planoprotostelium fungivorum TaxID=1890364 RepID=A0A2P6NQK3_9EUKA|nr:hypothetical protein PROFUN_05753 [Planoprotostelium fungivorum]
MIDDIVVAYAYQRGLSGKQADHPRRAHKYLCYKKNVSYSWRASGSGSVFAEI